MFDALFNFLILKCLAIFLSISSPCHEFYLDSEISHLPLQNFWCMSSGFVIIFIILFHCNFLSKKLKPLSELLMKLESLSKLFDERFKDFTTNLPFIKTLLSSDFVVICRSRSNNLFFQQNIFLWDLQFLSILPSNKHYTHNLYAQLEPTLWPLQIRSYSMKNWRVNRYPMTNLRVQREKTDQRVRGVGECYLLLSPPRSRPLTTICTGCWGVLLVIVSVSASHDYLRKP